MESIAHWIHKRRDITPERTALISKYQTNTYRQLSVKVNQMAAHLQNRYKLEKGDRVAILSGNREEYMLAYFAIAQLGLVAVPLNTRLSAPELIFQINDSGAKTLIYEEETAELVNAICKHANFESVYLFDEAFQEECNELPRNPTIDMANDPFIICYTSGTTGRPKGAVLTQENMFWNALNNQYAIDMTSADNVIVLLPLFHIGGIGLFALPSLLAGGTIIIPGKFDPADAIQTIEDYDVTIVMGVPAIHDAIRKQPEFETATFQSVRWFYSGGAPCPEELIHTFLERGLPFGQGMGMTETSPTIFMLSKEDYHRKVGSIGKPVMFSDMALVNEAGRPVENGDVGELLVKGPNIFKRYWGLPGKTDEAIRDGWFYTGDLMRQDEEGFVYVAGRKKDMIISGGENIYPLEVEQVLKKLPQISEAAVIGLADEVWGEVPGAVVSLSQNSLTVEAIRTHCLQELAKFKVPKRIVITDALPKNATGKVEKKKLSVYLTSEIEN